MTKPITPDEVTPHKLAGIDPAVIEIFNGEIAKRWNGRQAVVKQHEIVSLICLRFTRLTRDGVRVNGYLEIEPIYEAVGWKVARENSGPNETGDPMYVFTKAK